MKSIMIESEFHDLTAEVEVPDHVRDGMVVAWLRDNDPESLEKVCPFDGCQCEISEYETQNS